MWFVTNNGRRRRACVIHRPSSCCSASPICCEHTLTRSGPPMLLQKLRVKPDVPLVILNLPPDCKSLFDDREYKTSKPRTGAIEQLIFFAKDAATLEDQFVPLVPQLVSDPLAWVLYPKKSGSIASDLSMTEGWKHRCRRNPQRRNRSRYPVMARVASPNRSPSQFFRRRSTETRSRPSSSACHPVPPQPSRPASCPDSAECFLHASCESRA